MRIRQPFKKLHSLEQFTVPVALLKYFVSFTSSVIVSVFVLDPRTIAENAFPLAAANVLSVSPKTWAHSASSDQNWALLPLLWILLHSVATESLTADPEENK